VYAIANATANLLTLSSSSIFTIPGNFTVIATGLVVAELVLDPAAEGLVVDPLVWGMAAEPDPVGEWWQSK